MPELPEVETIKLFLAKNLIGLKIESIDILNPKSFTGDSTEILNKEIKDLKRRGKSLQINFGDKSLLIHLKMSGQMAFRGNKSFVGGHPTTDMFGDLPNKSTRVIFNLSGGAKLFFNDQRKFGWIKLIKNEDLLLDKFLKNLGPEPLDKEFSLEIFKTNLLKRKNTTVKVAILDQVIVAGVGNIYACEACFIAGIDPGKKVNNLSDGELKKLHQAIIESLKMGIKYGGSSKTHFANPEGKRGLFLNYAYVYGREKLPCKICKTPIQKIKLGGRGTYFCSKCQVA